MRIFSYSFHLDVDPLVTYTNYLHKVISMDIINHFNYFFKKFFLQFNYFDKLHPTFITSISIFYLPFNTVTVKMKLIVFNLQKKKNYEFCTDIYHFYVAFYIRKKNLGSFQFSILHEMRG